MAAERQETGAGAAGPLHCRLGVGSASLPRPSEQHGVHPWDVVATVFSGVSEPVFESTGLLRECPHQALSSRLRVRCAHEHRVRKGHGGINPLPPRLFERPEDGWQEECVYQWAK